MTRILAFLYGVVCYAVFFATFLYAVGFLGNVGVPKSIDSGREGSLLAAIAVDSALLGLFALQHSIMARPAFKRMWTRVVPPPVERSTYVLFSSAALLLLFWQWRPLGGVIWDVRDTVMEMVMMAGFAAGFLIVLVSTFLINHFDLFGLRQVTLFLRKKPYTPLAFRTPFFYKYVRHPLYVGWFLAFWCTSIMTAAHLLFAVMTTAYILVAIRFEEKDLTDIHGEDYRRYREQVPMLIPSLSTKTAPSEITAELS